MDEPPRSDPLVIGLSSLKRAAWCAELVAHVAHDWAMMGYTVAVVDGDPWGAAPDGWAADEPGDHTLSELLDGAVIGVNTALASIAMSAALGEVIPCGSLGLMLARGDKAPPEAPTARSVLFAREALHRALVGFQRADVVLVRLPPLCEPVGQALAANLVDVLVPLLSPLELPHAAPFLARSASMQATDHPVLPVELSANPIDVSLWRAFLGQGPAAQLRIGRGASEDGDELRALVSAFSDFLRPHAALAHPEPTEQILEADALEQSEGAYAGFRRLLARDVDDAMRFFRDTLAGRSATLRSAAEALRAMDDAAIRPELLAYGLRYVVQKFRVAEPDPLSGFVRELGERLLAAGRLEPLNDRVTRLKIEVACAMVNHARYLDSVGAHDPDLPQAANRLLLEATEEVERSTKLPGACLRLGEGFARHGMYCGHSRNAELALNLIALAEQRGVDTLIARQAALDALWAFIEGERNPVLMRLQFRLANDLMALDASYAHYYLAPAWTQAGDKVRALEHFVQLTILAPERMKMAWVDPMYKEFFHGAATPHFYKSARKKGFDPSER